MIHITIAPETIFTVAGFPVTNTLLTAWLVTLLLAVGAYLISRQIKPIPGRLQALVELTIEGLVNFFTDIAGSRETARKYFPLVATIFIFILAANWSGILPGVGSVGFTEMHEGTKVFVPIFRSVNSDINMTLALAFVAVTFAHIVGITVLGIIGHIKKFIDPKHPISFFVGPLEMVGEISKVVSLSFRLFGNVFAGEVLLVIITALVPYLAPLPFLGLEIFVGFIQALIFAVLAMLYLASAEKAASH